MRMIEEYKIDFVDFLDSIAIDVLTDREFELEYQGLCKNDKCHYLKMRGFNYTHLLSIN